MKGLIHHNVNPTSNNFSKYVGLPSGNAKLHSVVRSTFPDLQWSVEQEATVTFFNRIAFYLQSDTLVKSALPLIRRLKETEYTVYVPEVHRENSDVQLEAEGIPFEVYSTKAFKQYDPDVLVLFNDWSKLAKRVILHARKRQVPSICIQESMIDFSDGERMTFADVQILQAPFYLSKLDVPRSFITGNPRYEHLIGKTSSRKEVVINCNFTYGIHEEARTQWLNDITQTLDRNADDYIVSQHPRDKGDLSSFKNVVPSSAAGVHEQLASARLLITRFSSLIHEALFFKVPVIYYNPHNEDQIGNVEIDGNVVQLAKTSEELQACIQKLDRLTDRDFNRYIQHNCMDLECPQLPSELIVTILRNLRVKVQKVTLSERFKSVYYHPFIRRISGAIRNK